MLAYLIISFIVILVSFLLFNKKSCDSGCKLENNKNEVDLPLVVEEKTVQEKSDKKATTKKAKKTSKKSTKTKINKKPPPPEKTR